MSVWSSSSSALFILSVHSFELSAVISNLRFFLTQHVHFFLWCLSNSKYIFGLGGLVVTFWRGLQIRDVASLLRAKLSSCGDIIDGLVGVDCPYSIDVWSETTVSPLLLTAASSSLRNMIFRSKSYSSLVRSYSERSWSVCNFWWQKTFFNENIWVKGGNTWTTLSCFLSEICQLCE